MAAKQGFLMYYSKGDAIGTNVSVRYRRSGRLSEVVVKRGSTVQRHIRASGCQVDQFKEEVFGDFRSSLDAEMKRIQGLGVGT